MKYVLVFAWLVLLIGGIWKVDALMIVVSALCLDAATNRDSIERLERRK